MQLRDETYIAPNLFSYLKYQNPKPQYNQSKSDVFSLGITVLEAATL